MSTKETPRELGAALFGSARRGVLALLFGHPQETYYLRQVARLTGLGLGAVQREVNRLSAFGILRRTVSGHQVYFQANEDGPLFHELRGLVTKTAGAVETLHSALSPLRGRIRAAFLYGSVAEGREHSGSDVDLIVVGDPSFEEVVAALASAEQSMHREVNPTVYPASEFLAKRKSGHHFVTAVMRGPKIWLIGDAGELARLGSRRMAGRASQQRRRDSGSPRSR
jgi:uncharacterized protein